MRMLPGQCVQLCRLPKPSSTPLRRRVKEVSAVTTKPESSGTAEWVKLGGRLKEIREYLNFSQQYVSDRTGIPRTAISDIERGARRVDSLELKKLARLYRYP